jgi:hypothetical protein
MGIRRHPRPVGRSGATSSGFGARTLLRSAPRRRTGHSSLCRFADSRNTNRRNVPLPCPADTPSWSRRYRPPCFPRTSLRRRSRRFSHRIFHSCPGRHPGTKNSTVNPNDRHRPGVASTFRGGISVLVVKMFAIARDQFRWVEARTQWLHPSVPLRRGKSTHHSWNPKSAEETAHRPRRVQRRIPNRASPAVMGGPGSTPSCCADAMPRFPAALS